MTGYKTVNLEDGLPTADQAIRRLTWELAHAKKLQYVGLKLIHGYGSSGKGGVLRVQVRDYLLRQHRKERLSIFDEDTRIAMELCPELRMDRDLDRHNNGITVVIL